MSNETFSKSTFRGALILALVLIVLFVLPDVIQTFSAKESISIKEWDEKTKKAIVSVEKNASSSRNNYDRGSKFNAPPAKFNPNEYTLEEWMALGLSQKQAEVVLKFTRYPLRSNNDLKKIVVINDELFELIKDSTIYNPSNVKYEKEDFSKAVKQSVVLDVNTASVEELQQIKGIGPFFAKQIVKRRTELGGYHDINQLLEIWKMDEEKLAQWKPSLYVSKQLQKININQATLEELQAHPYISWNLANSIVKLRLQNGNFKKIEEVKKSALMTETLFEQLKWYITVE